MFVDSPRHAIIFGSTIAAQIQKSAALSGVPLFVACIVARRKDHADAETEVLAPYPVIEFRTTLESRFSAVNVLLAGLADGRRSTSVFYRFLAFFKIVESFIERLQPALTKECAYAGVPFDKFDLTLPDDPIGKVSPPLVGMKYTAYRDRVQGEIRDVIAHLDPAADIVPFDVQAESRVTTASIVLHYIAMNIVEFVERSLTTLAKIDPTKAEEFVFRKVDKRRKRTTKK